MTPRLFRDGLAFTQVTRVVTAVRCGQPKVLDWHAEVLSTLLHYWPVFVHSSALKGMTLPQGQALFGSPSHTGILVLKDGVCHRRAPQCWLHTRRLVVAVSKTFQDLPLAQTA